MTVDDLLDKLISLKRAGKIDGDDTIVVRDINVSNAAMEAGSDGWVESDEILVPGDERVMLTGFGWDEG